MSFLGEAFLLSLPWARAVVRLLMSCVIYDHLAMRNTFVIPGNTRRFQRLAS